MVLLLEAIIFVLPPFWKLNLFYKLKLFLPDYTDATDWSPCYRRLLWSITEAYGLWSWVGIDFIRNWSWWWCLGYFRAGYSTIGTVLVRRAGVGLRWRRLFSCRSLYGFGSLIFRSTISSKWERNSIKFHFPRLKRDMNIHSLFFLHILRQLFGQEGYSSRIW